jgi:hypothetical protein
LTGIDQPLQADKSDRSLRSKAITNALLGQQVSRLCRVSFDFASKVRHENAQIVRLVHVVGPPDFIEEETVSENLASVSNKRGQ